MTTGLRASFADEFEDFARRVGLHEAGRESPPFKCAQSSFYAGALVALTKLSEIADTHRDSLVGAVRVVDLRVELHAFFESLPGK